MTPDSGTPQCEDAGADRFRHGLESVLGAPFTKGNDIRVLQNGEEIFPAMIEAIRGAQRRVEFLTFVYWTGDVATEMANALAERARAGVEVFVLLDGFGARPMRPDLLKMMEEAGCTVRWYNPLPRLRVWKTDNRTHRKVLIVDGETGFTGGVGIAAEWEGAGDDPDHWRDNHFVIRGPAVRCLRGGFYGDWMEATESVAGALDEPKRPDEHGPCEMQVLVAQASIGLSAIARLQEALVRLARRRLRVQTPYFSPAAVQLEALLDARRRGVEVEFMIPGPYNDKRVSELASSPEIGQLFEAGVKFWRFQPTMLHSKTILVDDCVTSVGTANYNQRSILKDNELAVTVLDRGFAARMEEVWEADLAHCVLNGPEDWRRRGILRRVAERISRPVQSEV